MAKPGRAVGNQFWLQVVKRLGVPRKHQRNAIRFLRAQQSGEGTQATWNPLGTTRPGRGSTGFNSVGVQNFPNRRVGIRATVDTYLNGHYDGIVSDLRKGVPARSIATGRLGELETWGTGSLVAERLGSTPMPQLPASNGGGNGNTPPGRGPRAPAAAPAQGDQTMRKLLALQLLQMASAPEIDFEGMLPLLQQASQMRTPAATPPTRDRPGGRGPVVRNTNLPPDKTEQGVIAVAREFLQADRRETYDMGSPYGRSIYPKNTRDVKSFDCSSFIQYIYWKATGRKLVESGSVDTSTLWTRGKKVNPTAGALVAGDAVFFGGSGGVPVAGGSSHVGMYIGNGKFIHSSSSGQVKISDLASYGRRPIGARRYL